MKNPKNIIFSKFFIMLYLRKNEVGYVISLSFDENSDISL